MYTVHGFLLHLLDTVVLADVEEKVILGVGDLSDLIVLIDEVPGGLAEASLEMVDHTLIP